MSSFVAAALLCQLPLEHTVHLTPEVRTVRRGDPLLVRIEVRHGLLRPSHYPRGLSPVRTGLIVAVAKPGGQSYEVVRTADYDTYRPEFIPAAGQLPVPAGTTDAVFMWVVSSSGMLRVDEPGEFRRPSAPGDEPGPKPPGPAVFDISGDYLLRARVVLRDAAGAPYEVRSAPIAVRVQAQAPAATGASDAVRTTLYRCLPGNQPAPEQRQQLRAALPALGESADASAARRLLALSAVRTSPPGAPRQQAIAECDRLRATLPAVGRGAFDLDYAAALAAVGEFEKALDQVRLAPDGPRRQSDGSTYYGQVLWRKEQRPVVGPPKP